MQDERKKEIRESLAESTRNLLLSGATILILACNTSHFFLEDIYRKVPSSHGKFINIIDWLGKALCAGGQSSDERTFMLLASEGTLDSGIYQKYLSPYGIKIKTPERSVHPVLRDLIEDVKKDKIAESTTEKFIDLCSNLGEQRIIIGCTEFPPILARCRMDIRLKGYELLDPLESVIEHLKELYQQS